MITRIRMLPWVQYKSRIAQNPTVIIPTGAVEVYGPHLPMGTDLYVADSLADDFSVLQADDGEQGLAMARQHIPDVIVSDVIMPSMDGIRLTRSLKGDVRTSHIPVVLLTAKATDDDRLEGYECGADSFITKPFTARMLVSRIQNLLTARRRMAEYLVSHPVLPAEPANGGERRLSRLDREFLDRLNGIIADNIMRQDLDLPFVTRQMAMSHSTFYRKVKALTGKTATEYIRTFRLRQSYRLLESGDYNVGEAAAMTGFNQMAHFREVFKREFGILPSEVMKKKQT
jgi:CheY-like chemotaxis protein